MPFLVPIEQAAREHPEYDFIRALAPSEQKAAFHIRDSSGRDLCLKIISPDYELDRLNREVHTLQSITHPNIVRLIEYTFSSTPGSLRHFMVEDYIEGSDLEERLGGGRRWQRPEAARFFSELFAGLSALDEKNIVHRDLKPRNIRVRPNGSPVIIDFGVARLLDLPDITSTSEGAGIGTPCYFAPEQFHGTKHDIDPRTDLFAVGIILHQALIGTHPFYRAGMTRQEICEAISTSEDYERSGEFVALPQNWSILMKKLLAKNRSSRPRHAASVVDILRRLESV